MVEYLMQRRADIDRAKGLAILLVVFGHLVARADPAGVVWYEPLRRAIYSFHMPFFFYLSGLVLMLSGAALRPPPGWLRRRAVRLLVPFLALGLLVVFGKYACEKLMFVDHAPLGLMTGVKGMIWHTQDSPDGSIWYLFVLFCYSAAAPMILHGNPGRLGWLAPVTAIIFFVPLPDYVYAGQIGRYAVFFTLGLWAGAHNASWHDFIGRTWRAWCLLLLPILIIAASFGAAVPALILLPAGLAAIPALHGLVRYSRLSSSPSLLWLGRYCFMIYLFNTIFIGLAKAMLLAVTSWDGPHFLPFATCLMLAGIFGPVGLKHLAFRRVAGLDRLTD
jgi:fucose 4-O-acetylase-like acetyltransferase